MFDDMLTMFCLIRRNFQASRDVVENDIFILFFGLFYIEIITGKCLYSIYYIRLLFQKKCIFF